MVTNPRVVTLALLALMSTGLSVVLTASPATSKEILTERWCADTAAPCLLSASRNGVDLTAGDPDIEIQLTSAQTANPDYDYFSFIVVDNSGDLLPSDLYSLTFDLGTLRPDRSESYSARPDIDRIDDGDGTHKFRITGRPVHLTYGCNDSYPIVCPSVATSDAYEFSGEVYRLKTDLTFQGFDQAQDVDVVNGIYLVDPGDAPAYLVSEWGNSHYETDGTTVVHGQARFRISYTMLRRDFAIPNPETMTATSMVGSINGSPATFEFTQDPDGDGMIVDISGVTFSKRTVKVKRGTITPTRPKLRKAKRPAARKAKVYFDRAKARGAKVKGYQARCVAGKQVRYASAGKSAFKSKIVVKGLTPGRHYKCSVRAKSKAGPGKWSNKKRV